jgi:cytochrome c553
MFKGLAATAFGAAAIAAAIAMPAAADDIEAKVQVCGACHGTNGVPTSPTIPVIWGQQQNYLVKQLHDYRAEDRNNPIMAPVAAGIKQEDTRPIAAYFAGKTWPTRPTPAAATPEPAKIAMCKACHQPNFEGGAPAPRLAGLSYDYLVSAMKSFADGERTNNGDMPKFMKALGDSERQEMAKYLAGL